MLENQFLIDKFLKNLDFWLHFGDITIKKCR